MKRVPAAALVALLGAAAPPPAAPDKEFRFSRPIETSPGWARLELPDDVFDACRAGLPDLRIVDGTGREVPYVIEETPSDAWKPFRPLNLESTPDVETIFQIDRGPRPGLADAVTFEIAGSEYLKPVRVQSSDDRSTWKDAASGSIFATGDVRMRTLSIPETDRRYLQFLLDDRNGPPIRPERVRVRVRGSEKTTLAERPVALELSASDSSGLTRYRAALPAANLPVSLLRFEAADALFSRPVRVYERVFFRDEVHRRLVAAAMLTRAPGSKDAIDLPANGIAGRNLEIEIDNGDSPPLSNLSARALVGTTTLRFATPAEGGLRLLYGSPSARAPRYDLGRALAGRSGPETVAASLGAPVEERTQAPLQAVAAPPRAPLADPESWSVRLNIALPAQGTAAYLDFEDLPDPAEIRILDAENRQVPFIVEQGSHEHSSEIRFDVENHGTTTRARLDGLPAGGAVDAIELRASEPDYFSRAVGIEEEERDARGVTGTRTLGGARWERRPGEPAPVLRIAITRPADASHRVFAVIENGDNVPLTLSGARALTSARRVDFVYRPGEKLTLLSGNPQARPPAYDLAMVASAVLAAPAEAARLQAPAPVASPKKETRPAWFWAAVAAAVLLLLFQLRRVLEKSA